MTPPVSRRTRCPKLLPAKPVSERPTARVLEAATKLGYVRNKVAANLKDSATRTVGVLTASGRNQYYAMVVQASDAVLQNAGYHAVSNDAMRGDTYSAETERLSVEDLLQQRVAAVVATYSLFPESLALLKRWNIPVVFADSSPPEGSESYAYVGIDNYAASEEVANYLADLGHRKVVYLAYPREWATRVPREQGFVQSQLLLIHPVEIQHGFVDLGLVVPSRQAELGASRNQDHLHRWSQTAAKTALHLKARSDVDGRTGDAYPR